MNNKQPKIFYVVALSLFVNGCELIGPKQTEKLPLGVVKPDDETGAQEVVYQELSNKAAEQEDAERIKTELYPGTGRFVSQGGKGHEKVRAHGKGEYSLNFDEADLGEVAKVILSDILGKNYVLSPKVGGSVTLQTTQPLSKEELLPTLDMLLKINNAAMVFQNGIYQIKPAEEVATSGSFFALGAGRGMEAGQRIKVVPVNYVSVDELAEIIKPLMQEKSILHIDSDRNLLLISGTPAELVRAMEMVKTFDVDVMQGRSFGLFPLQHVEAKKIIEELEQIFNKKSDEGGFIKFMDIERLNSVLAITHQARYLKEIERWVIRLDRANTSVGGGVIVYRAQHVDAVELATTLNDIFSKSASSARSGGTVAAGRQSVQITNRGDAGDQQGAASRTNTSNQSTASVADLGDVKIIADEVNNALVIVATAQEYQVIQRVIKQLDVMPLQVLIDATIVDVTLKDNLQYGIQWYLSHNNGGQNAINSGGAAGVSLTSIAAGVASGGLSYQFLSDSNDIRAILSAEANNDNINVISSPSLMVLNNQEASIQVGNEISLRTSQNTPLTGGTNTGLIQTNSLQQRKTGVKLKVKPRVNASGLVIMELQQSVEDPGPAKDDGSNPDILTREISSSVAVHSGETVVLGGLIKENNSQRKVGIPILHELPLIGPLFGSTTNNQDRTELVVLITPRVVRSKQDGRLVTDEFKRKLTGIYYEPESVEDEEESL